jgi:two-component system cell cycle response regulator
LRSPASSVARGLARSERESERDTLIEGLSRPPQSSGSLDRCADQAQGAQQRGVLLRTDRRGCGQLIALTSEKLRLGRSWEAEGHIEDDSVSRLHAEISVDQGAFFITDLASANGTFVDGERIASAPLQDGSVLRLGTRVSFRFSLMDEDEQRALSSLQDLGHCDPLTRLYNRRHLEQHLAAEFAFAERHSSSISLILLDLDRFKQVNDQHGHPAGDLVLERVAERMTSKIRTEDMLARYGGEEFIIVLRETPIVGAEVLAERIRGAVAETPIEIAPGVSISVTLSAGCASLACSAEAGLEQMLELADRRLYLAKQQGRNRVIGALSRLRSIPVPAPELDSENDDEPPSQVRQLEQVVQAFDQLPEELKLVVGLRYQEDCSFAEIAAILDSTEQRVQELYEQARLRLRPSAA